jgi:ubiquinone/menaquinone biosynthesis C-methylase UbiE
MFSSPLENIEKMGIQPGMKIADFGSGVGTYTLPLARFVGELGKVYAVDVQKDLLNRLKKEAESAGVKNIEIIWADLDLSNGSKMKDKSLDRVLIINTMFQVESREGVLKEARRILKPEGKLIIIDWEASFSGMGPESSQVISRDAMIMLVREFGYTVETNFDAGDHHYGLICRT